MFPADVVDTVESLARLHAVSEQLDSEMGSHVSAPELTPAGYAKAWKRTGRRDARRLQIDLLIGLGRAMQLYVRRPWLRQALRSMRMPAKVAGLADLQRFLERGFDTFASLNNPSGFLACIAEREQGYAELQFSN